MNPLIFIAMAVGMSFAARGPQGDPVQAELARFQGTWQLVSVRSEGKQVPDDQIADVRVVIRGNRHTVHVGDQVAAREIPFTLDPKAMPRQVTDQLPDGRTIQGIYELEGDTLRSCVAPPGKDRPAEFSAEPGSGHTLRVFRRVPT
jgi:uncharacterized protein (TIGR03067 family)